MTDNPVAGRLVRTTVMHLYLLTDAGAAKALR